MSEDHRARRSDPGRPRARHLVLTLEVDGRFGGWSRLEPVLSRALASLLGEPPDLLPAARPGPGVAAEGLAVGVRSRAGAAAGELPAALAAVLPPAVAVVSAEPWPTPFHPHRSVEAITYRQAILTRPSPSWRGRAWAPAPPPAPRALARAAARVRAAGDLGPFRDARLARASRPGTARLDALELELDGAATLVRVRAPRLAERTVRRLVGCLVAAASGRIPEDALSGGSADLGPLVAPPRGLVLEAVQLRSDSLSPTARRAVDALEAAREGRPVSPRPNRA